MEMKIPPFSNRKYILHIHGGMEPLPAMLGKLFGKNGVGWLLSLTQWKQVKLVKCNEFCDGVGTLPFIRS